MKNICFYFQVHQPFRLKHFRFFDISQNQNYFDDKANHDIMRKVAEKCYLPASNLMLDLIKKYKGKFKISYSISGIALDQFELYAPDVLESFKKLAKTGCVEFLAETYAHSLASVISPEEFKVKGINTTLGYEIELTLVFSKKCMKDRRGVDRIFRITENEIMDYWEKLIDLFKVLKSNGFESNIRYYQPNGVEMKIIIQKRDEN